MARTLILTKIVIIILILCNHLQLFIPVLDLIKIHGVTAKESELLLIPHPALLTHIAPNPTTTKNKYISPPNCILITTHSPTWCSGSHHHETYVPVTLKSPPHHHPFTYTVLRIPPPRKISSYNPQITCNHHSFTKITLNKTRPWNVRP